jgi:hypothetical protein
MVPQCKRVGWEIGYLLGMGKRASPTPVVQKRRHRFYLALLNWWLPAGILKRNRWGVRIRQAD